ncbi:hypothetical protein CC79DRAFT_1356823 [Sarocladium strictum]
MGSPKSGAKAAVLASLVASSLASPVQRSHNFDQTPRNIFARGPEENNDVDSWCGLAEVLNLEENGDEALAGTTLGGTLDMFITQVNDKKTNGWLGDFIRYVYRNDEMSIESATDCATLGGICKLGQGETCKQAFEGDDDWLKESWWIFRSIQGAHAKMTKMRVALGLVSTAIDLTMPEEEEPEELSLTGVKTSLGGMFERSVKGLDQIARVAVGRPWGKDKVKDLPNFDNKDWESPIANFYDHAFWLLDSDSEPVSEVIDSTVKILRHHHVDSILQALGYAIIWDPEIDNQSDCSREPRRWLNVGGKDRCFYLAAKADADYAEAPEDSKIYGHLVKWGVKSLEKYFKSSIACARTTCKTAQALAVEEEDLPLCFYSAPVKKIDRFEETGCNHLEPLKKCNEIAVVDFFDDDVKTGCPS